MPPRRGWDGRPSPSRPLCPSSGPLRGLRGHDAGSLFLGEKSVVPSSWEGPIRFHSGRTANCRGQAGLTQTPGPGPQAGTREDLPTPVKVKGLAQPTPILTFQARPN